MSEMFIVNRLGVVHSTQPVRPCAAATAERKVPVSSLQILLHRLSPCLSCFVSVVEFGRLAGAGRAL